LTSLFPASTLNKQSTMVMINGSFDCDASCSIKAHKYPDLSAYPRYQGRRRHKPQEGRAAASRPSRLCQCQRCCEGDGGHRHCHLRPVSLPSGCWYCCCHRRLTQRKPNARCVSLTLYLTVPHWPLPASKRRWPPRSRLPSALPRASLSMVRVPLRTPPKCAPWAPWTSLLLSNH